MKQRALMVLCVLLGAGLVMMCDSDAVQDMMDGQEAQAATTSELAGITCPDGAVLVESVVLVKHGVSYVGSCWDTTIKQAHGSTVMRCPNGQVYFKEPWVDGQRHGLATWSGVCGGEDEGEFRGWCYDEGTTVWECSHAPSYDSKWPVYECSTQEDVDALVAEHGCP